MWRLASVGEVSEYQSTRGRQYPACGGCDRGGLRMSNPIVSDVDDLIAAHITHGNRLKLVIDRWTKAELQIQQVLIRIIWAINWVNDSDKIVLQQELESIVKLHDDLIEEYRECVEDFHGDFIKIADKMREYAQLKATEKR